jgi:hypothetical protein
MEKEKQYNPDFFEDIINPYKQSSCSIFIPEGVFKLPLSTTAKICLGFLLKHSEEKGYCSLSQKLLAKKIGADVITIRIALHQLEKEGIIKIRKAEGLNKLAHKTDTYFFKNHPIWVQEK